MRPYAVRSAISVLVLFLALAGCASKQQIVPGSAGPVQNGWTSMAVEVDSYCFRPNEIQVEKPCLAVVEVKNVSSRQHNFTLVAPNGLVLRSMDVNPRKTLKTRVEFPVAGTYKFYSFENFYAWHGMIGHMNVNKPAAQ